MFRYHPLYFKRAKVIGVLAGSFILFLSCIGIFYQLSFWNNSTSSQGKIFSLKESGLSKKKVFPVVEFEHLNKRYLFESNYEADIDEYFVGNVVEIRIPIDNPNDAVIDHFMNLWGFPLISFALGSGIILFHIKFIS
jgi:hypothetical protein